MNKKPLLALSAYNFFYYSLFSIVSFLPLYLSSVHLSGTDIGTLLGIGPFFMMIIPPLWGFISDKLGKIKEVLLFILMFSLILGFIVFKMTNYWSIAFLLSGFYMFFAAIMPLTDSMTYRISENSQISFGAVRLFGSLGFAIMSAFLGFFLMRYGSSVLSNLFVVTGILSMLSLFLIKEENGSGLSSERSPVKISDFFQLMRNPTVLLFFAMVFLVSLPHRINDSFLSLYIKEVGGNDSLAGLAWFIAALFEALVFSFSQRWMKSGKENQLIVFAILVYAMRWGLNSFIHNPYLIVGLQILHSLTFAIFYLTMLQQFTKRIPSHLRASAQTALLAIFFGVSGIIGSIIGGVVFEYVGGQVLYGMMAGITLLSLPLQFKLMKKY